MADSEEPDVARLVETLDRHGVEYLVVGGSAARAYGARRPTEDLDCLVRQELVNLERLGAAMRELNARLVVEGMTDQEARQLPVQLDGATLARMNISTWRTDAGRLDVLTAIPAADGRRVGYDELVQRANLISGGNYAIRAAALSDIIASKESANRPKDHEALPELYEMRAALE